jgi:DNA-directed RNA polymerase subunit RPC12/RpoP
MAIIVGCVCGKKYQVNEDLAGKLIRCKHCQATIVVPAASAVAAAPPRVAKAIPAAPAAPPAPPPFVKKEPETPEADDETKPRKKKRRKSRAAITAYGQGDSLEDRLSRSTDDSDRKADLVRGFKHLAWGVLLIVLSFVIYWYFASWEEEGGRRRINAIIFAIYKITGKWGTAIIIATLGAVGCVIGILNLCGFSIVVGEDE